MNRFKKIIWVFCVGIFVSLLIFNRESIKEKTLSILYRESTIYASNYSKRKFNSIFVGMPLIQVIELIGNPLKKEPVMQLETWHYRSNTEIDKNKFKTTIEIGFNANDYIDILFNQDGLVVSSRGNLFVDFNKTHIGKTKQSILNEFGQPLDIGKARNGYCFSYSSPKNNVNKTHYVRNLYFDTENRVSEIEKYLWID